MKNVKIKATLKDKVKAEIIDLSFDEKDIKILELYKENFDRLQSARLIEDGLPYLKKISWNAQKGSKFTVSEFNYQDVSELLHLSRPFFLSREPASFEKTCSVFGKRGKGTSLTNHLKYIRSLYKKGEYLPLFQISIDDTPLFDDKILRSWLNGIEYHQDEEKKDIVKKLESALGKDTTRSIFVCQLSGRVKALYMLAHLVILATK